MPGFLAKYLGRGVRAISSFFVEQDTLKVREDVLFYKSSGKRGQCSIRDVKSALLSQSFLGLFGSTLTIHRKNKELILVSGLEEDNAKKLKRDIDNAYKKLMTTEALANISSVVLEIDRAFKSLDVNQYISAQQLESWLIKFGDLRFLEFVDEEIINKSSDSCKVLFCREVFKSPEEWLSTRNNEWVERTLIAQRNQLDNISSLNLSRAQREVVLRNDNHVLAVAGAGTGKTATVVSKVKYLISSGWCKPGEVLLLSFSKNATDELKTRVAEAVGYDVSVKTFHALGHEIIHKATGVKPSGSDQASQGIVSKLLFDAMKSKEKQAKLLGFVAYHFYPEQNDRNFDTQKEKLEHSSGLNFETLQKEIVKSYSEVQIANWLYLNQIKYEYEANYKPVKTASFNRRTYRPDFYLPEYEIYIEHFGIGRDGGVAPYIDRSEYHAQMQWKRELHKKNQSNLVETFQYMSRDGSLIRELRGDLLEKGVQINPLTAEQIAGKKEIQTLLQRTAKLISTAICLFKEDRVPIEEIEKLVLRSRGIREKKFFELFQYTLDKYNSYLNEREEIDFSDMITQASAHVESGRYQSPYRVVIIDEFQDISRGRAWLVNTLTEQVKDSRLLCVGDDWQSIYRFAGSDVSLMTGFQSTWSRAVRIDLDKTYRFNNRISELSSRFIQQNPGQLKKTIQANSNINKAAIHIIAQEQAAWQSIVQRISELDGTHSVFILARYNHLLPDITDSHAIYKNVDLSAMTVHKSKGLEADYVIILGLESGQYGFPTAMHDDPMIRLFLADADAYTNSEERRLLYVAITRARKEVWLVANSDKPSVFVEEIVEEPAYKHIVDMPGNSIGSQRCSLCGSVMISKVNHRTGAKFMSCVHYPRCKGVISSCPACNQGLPSLIGGKYKCDSPACNTEYQMCSICSTGYLYKLRGKYGEFTACSEYANTGCRAK